MTNGKQAARNTVRQPESRPLAWENLTCSKVLGSRQRLSPASGYQSLRQGDGGRYRLAAEAENAPAACDDSPLGRAVN